VSGGASVAVAHVTKAFDRGRVRAVDDVSFTIEPSEFAALTGPSGSGKSTLLGLVGALDRADSGEISVDGRPLAELEPSEYRAATVGFVFQLHHLIPTLTALENVQVPMLGRGLARRGREERARALLAEVGLSHRLASHPGALSGGERQRVAVARALANGPRLLLADEPTGALDSTTGAQIVDLLQRLRHERGMTVFLVTNDDAVAQRADRAVRLRDGRITPDGALRPA
jgi:putative ABC transport system ATP-binding protein